MKKKLLFISQPQYGYQIDYFNYCKYLIKDFDITYICFDYGNDKILNDNIKIVYVKSIENKFKSKLYFFREVINQIKTNEIDICFVYYYLGCLLLPLFYSNKKIKYVLDIRSGSVTFNKVKRKIINTLICFESFFFNHISIISEGLRKDLFIPKKKSFILPLGCDPISTKTKIFSTSLIHLLYIGTFNNRNIHETIYGLNDFILKNPDKKKSLRYTIIGSGDESSVFKIKKSIIDSNLTDCVQLKGYIKNSELLQYFEDANIGVSYVPITKYYDNQPPTKTYEYLQAGMPVIATATKANKSIINKYNGVLIKDTYIDFSEKLGQVVDNMESYDSSVIKKTVRNNTWKIIVNKLSQHLQSIV
jgi:glycosyltransferase involved in cell wall biosynthesis